MEIHQIRYFLALAKSLNFTRAAEECHVSQPALTRAIQSLEAELGGELIRRERRTSHLTDLGRRMLPLLQRCYDSAMSAKELARSVTAELIPVRLLVSHTVPMDRLVGAIAALFPAFPNVQMIVGYGGGAEILERLKHGEVDFAIAGPLPETWERLDSWRLWEEGFCAVVAANHPLAAAAEINAAALCAHRLVTQTHCESRGDVLAWLEAHGVRPTLHEVVAQQHVLAFIEAGLGVGIAPQGVTLNERVRAIPIAGLTVTRNVSAYAVAGRARAAPSSALLSLLRAREGLLHAA